MSACQAPSASFEEEASSDPIEDGSKEEAQQDSAPSPPTEVGALLSEGEEADKAVTLEVHPISCNADSMPTLINDFNWRPVHRSLSALCMHDHVR